MQMQWTPALAVGHELIDAQHQELFRRFDALVRALTEADRAAVGQLYEFLGEYVVSHFAEEERLMGATGYPATAIHRAAHERFIRDYEDLKKLYAVGQELEAKILAVAPDGKIRLSLTALKTDDERADLTAYQKSEEKKNEGANKPVRGFGTLGDLLKGVKAAPPPAPKAAPAKAKR